MPAAKRRLFVDVAIVVHNEQLKVNPEVSPGCSGDCSQALSLKPSSTSALWLGPVLLSCPRTCALLAGPAGPCQISSDLQASTCSRIPNTQSWNNSHVCWPIPWLFLLWKDLIPEFGWFPDFPETNVFPGQWRCALGSKLLWWLEMVARPNFVSFPLQKVLTEKVYRGVWTLWA